MTFYFITHPNVVVSREVPVRRWPLSELGRQRMRAGLRQPWVKDIKAIYDRSATGFLPPDEFERVADQFFALPPRRRADRAPLRPAAERRRQLLHLHSVAASGARVVAGDRLISKS